MAPRGNQAKKDPTAEKEPIKLPSYSLHLVRDIIDQLIHYAADISDKYQLNGRNNYLIPIMVGIIVGTIATLIVFQYGIDGIGANDFIEWILTMPWLEYQK